MGGGGGLITGGGSHVFSRLSKTCDISIKKAYNGTR